MFFWNIECCLTNRIEKVNILSLKVCGLFTQKLITNSAFLLLWSLLDSRKTLKTIFSLNQRSKCIKLSIKNASKYENYLKKMLKNHREWHILFKVTRYLHKTVTCGYPLQAGFVLAFFTLIWRKNGPIFCQMFGDCCVSENYAKITGVEISPRCLSREQNWIRRFRGKFFRRPQHFCSLVNKDWRPKRYE